MESQTFDTEMKAFFDLMKDILLEKERTRLKIPGSSSNPFLDCLNNYIKVYHLSEPDDHKEYFLSLFKKYRIPILKGYKNDTWLRDGNVIIQFGEDTAAGKNLKKVRIHLSSIYNSACQLSHDAEQRLAGYTESARPDCPELEYPSSFLLHLYRILRECVDTPSDKQKLDLIVKEIENDLSIESDSPPSSSEQNPIGGIFKVVGNLLSSIGLKTDDNNMPSETELTNAFKGFFHKFTQDQRIQNVIGNTLKELKSCNNINEATKKLTSLFGDEHLMEAVAETISGTAQSAISDSEPPHNQTNQTTHSLPPAENHS